MRLINVKHSKPRDGTCTYLLVASSVSWLSPTVLLLVVSIPLFLVGDFGRLPARCLPLSMLRWDHSSLLSWNSVTALTWNYVPRMTQHMIALVAATINALMPSLAAHVSLTMATFCGISILM